MTDKVENTNCCDKKEETTCCDTKCCDNKVIASFIRHIASFFDKKS